MRLCCTSKILPPNFYQKHDVFLHKNVFLFFMFLVKIRGQNFRSDVQRIDCNRDKVWGVGESSQILLSGDGVDLRTFCQPEPLVFPRLIALSGLSFWVSCTHQVSNGIIFMVPKCIEYRRTVITNSERNKNPALEVATRFGSFWRILNQKLATLQL